MDQRPMGWRVVLLIALAALLCCEQSIAGTFRVANRRALRKLQREVQAAHFLSQATFGPTEDEISALAQRIRQIGVQDALSEWIDQQFELPMTSQEQTALQMISADGFSPQTANIVHNRYKHQAWWHIAITSPDQLRQRMAWALFQIFVINDQGAGFGEQDNDISGQPQFLGVANYYDMLSENAFGNYRELLGDVTYHPIMGVFLTHVKNAKGNGVRFPDENYAREIQQLFSIGLYKLRLNGQYEVDANGNLIDTYDNETIKSFARVFTGLTFDDAGRGFGNARRNYHDPMVMYDSEHDTDAKVLHNGTVLPAGQSGIQDIEMALDNLAEHPNVGPFISRLLIQRFTKSNPSKRYIRRVATAFNDSNGDLKSLMKAILLDDEARNTQSYRQLRSPLRLEVTTTQGALGTEQSRLREPVLRYTAMMRAYGSTSDANGFFSLPQLDYHLNQQAYRSPSVFNFYLPNHRPAGEFLEYQPSRRIPNRTVYAPEFEIMSAVATNRLNNRLRGAVYDSVETFTLLNNSAGTFRASISMDFSDEINMAGNPDELLSHLDLLLCHGSMSNRTKEIISAAIAEETTNATDRARGAILAVLTSPDCAVSE